jgi:hypothetical protein
LAWEFVLFFKNLVYLAGLFKATGTQYPHTLVTKKMDSERRQFLYWGVSGLVVGAIVMTPFSKFFTTHEKVSKNSKPSVHEFPEYFTVRDNYPKVLLHKYRLKVDGLVTTSCHLGSFLGKNSGNQKLFYRANPPLSGINKQPAMAARLFK